MCVFCSNDDPEDFDFDTAAAPIREVGSTLICNIAEFDTENNQDEQDSAFCDLGCPTPDFRARVCILDTAVIPP